MNDCPKSLNLPCLTAAHVLMSQFHRGKRTMLNGRKNFKEPILHNTPLFILLPPYPHGTMIRDMRLMNHHRGTIMQ